MKLGRSSLSSGAVDFELQQRTLIHHQKVKRARLPRPRLLRHKNPQPDVDSLTMNYSSQDMFMIFDNCSPKYIQQSSRSGIYLNFVTSLPGKGCVISHEYVRVMDYCLQPCQPGELSWPASKYPSVMPL